MRFATAQHGSSVVFGPIDGDALADVSATFPTPQDAIALASRAALDRTAASAPRVPLVGLSWLPPIPNPQRILCIGVNYADHRAETKTVVSSPNPTVFTRFPSSLVGHGRPIVRPAASHQFDYEGELAVVIGARGRHVAAERAHEIIAGWSCFMDGSIRDYQRHNSQFTPGKNFEHSGSFGPWIVTTDELPDAGSLLLSTRVAGEVLQQASTELLITGIGDLIAYCSTFTTLEPGDVIATGTPGGVGAARDPQRWMQPGELVEVEIEGIGTLANAVVDE